VELAKNLVQKVFINTDEALGGDEIASKRRIGLGYSATNYRLENDLSFFKIRRTFSNHF
jgi:hypothetical protein